MPTTQVTSEAVEKVVFDGLAELGAEREQISRDATFEAIDVDSLDLVELGQIVHEEYGVEIKGEDMPKLKTVGDVVELISARAGATA